MGLGVDRNDGLGWWFPLVFTVHAAAPGVAATALAWQAQSPARSLFLLASVLAWLPLVFLYLSAWKKRARILADELLVQRGTRVWAQVLDVKRLLGNAKTGGKRFVRASVTLRVFPSAASAYDVGSTAWYQSAEFQRLQPGSAVVVACDPTVPARVLVTDVHTPSVANAFGADGAARLGAVPPAQVVQGGAAVAALVAGGVLLAIVTVPVALFLAFTMDDKHQAVAEGFLREMSAGNSQAAFRRLAPALQAQVLDPEHLLQAWRGAGLLRVEPSFRCSRGGAGSWRLGFQGTIASQPVLGLGSYGFHLGQVSLSRCRTPIRMEVTDLRDEPVITAVSIDP